VPEFWHILVTLQGGATLHAPVIYWLDDEDRMKKLRGKKRFYERLAKDASNFRLELEGPNDWYDFWHHHFDWRGQGDKSGRERNEYLKATFTAFEKVLEQLKDYGKPYQVWLSFSAKRSYDDALYFHTPNPNQDNFPYDFEGYSWSAKVPALLAEYKKDEYEIGVTIFNEETWYCVRVKEELK
jgi:hypothetical protein